MKRPTFEQIVRAISCSTNARRNRGYDERRLFLFSSPERMKFPLEIVFLAVNENYVDTRGVAKKWDKDFGCEKSTIRLLHQE